MKTKLTALIVVASLVLSGCGGPKYACRVGEGVSCKSLSTVYGESITGELEKSIERQKRLNDDGEKEQKARAITAKTGGSVTGEMQPGDRVVTGMMDKIEGMNPKEVKLKQAEANGNTEVHEYRAALVSTSVQSPGLPSQETILEQPPALKLTSLPLRTRPEILTIMINPWEDAEGALHGGSYIYMVVNSGKWMVKNKEIRSLDKIIPLE